MAPTMEYPAQQWEVAPRSGMVYVMFLIIIYKRYDSCSQTIVVSIQAFDFRTINAACRWEEIQYSTTAQDSEGSSRTAIFFIFFQ